MLSAKDIVGMVIGGSQDPLRWLAASLSVLPILFGIACCTRDDAGAMTASTEPRPEGASGSWKLIFSDEFLGGSLDKKKWTRCYWWDRNGCTNLGNNELQWYLPANVTVEGGALRLRADRGKDIGPRGAYKFASGMVSTGSTRYSTQP